MSRRKTELRVFFDHVAHTGRNGCVAAVLITLAQCHARLKVNDVLAPDGTQVTSFCGVIDAGEHVVVARLQLIAFTANEVGVARLHIIVQSGKEVVISIAAITLSC